MNDFATTRPFTPPHPARHPLRLSIYTSDRRELASAGPQTPLDRHYRPNANTDTTGSFRAGRASAPPTTGRAPAPSMAGRASAPPSMGRVSAPPSMGRVSAPPSMGRVSAPSPANRASAPPPMGRVPTPPAPPAPSPSPAVRQYTPRRAYARELTALRGWRRLAVNDLLETVRRLQQSGIDAISKVERVSGETPAMGGASAGNAVRVTITLR